MYDNFKSIFDRSKLRSYTIGCKPKEPKKMKAPGPANYDTRNKANLLTQGGTGTKANLKYSFGSQKRDINVEVIRQAAALPSSATYNPSKKTASAKITFGVRKADLFGPKTDTPGPADYAPTTLNIQSQIRQRLSIQQPHFAHVRPHFKRYSRLHK